MTDVCVDGRPPSPLLPKAGFLCKGSTVAPLKALSKWLCCLASCSRVSSRRILWLRSTCRAFCQCLLWLWAKNRKSLHALRNRNASKRLGKRVDTCIQCMFQYVTVLLTFIIASEAILNIVALSVTCLTFSPASGPTQKPSSSDKDLCVM